MFKALFGSAAVFVILVFAVVAPVDVLKAQDVLQTPVAADELSDEETRQLLAKECNYSRGPIKPNFVFCEPADVSAEQVELYRESQRQQGSTFLTEPMPKF